MAILSLKGKNPPSERLIEIEAHQKNYLSQNRISLKKLELYDEDKERLFSQINAVKPQIIDGLKNAAIANLYMVKFPEGLPKVLTQLKQGGYMSFIREKGRMVGTASLVQASACSIAALNVFTAMSVVTGQYFLANINSQLSAINNKLDMIQASLDNDKKARLKTDEERIQNIIDGNRAPNEIAALDRDTDELLKYYIEELGSAYEIYKKKIKDDSFNRVLCMCVLLNQSMIALVKCRLLEALYGQRDLNIVRNETEDIINRCYNKINNICREMKGSLESKIQSKKVKGYLQALSNFGIESITDDHETLRENVSKAIELAGANEILIDSKHDLYLPVKT